MKYIIGEDSWRKAYAKTKDRRKIWIYIQTSDDKDIYLDDYRKWLTFQEYCDTNNVTIKNIGLRYRSHCVKMGTENAEAVYLIRSLKAELQGKTLDCYNIGLLNDGKVEKTMWIVPALVVESKHVDDFEECFEEAFVYNVRQSKTVQ
tara:strand:- start:296 stop:736 length:441 start_codon:yes stop_codon:yes gene_type:complete